MAGASGQKPTPVVAPALGSLLDLQSYPIEVSQYNSQLEQHSPVVTHNESRMCGKYTTSDQPIAD